MVAGRSIVKRAIPTCAVANGSSTRKVRSSTSISTLVKVTESGFSRKTKTLKVQNTLGGVAQLEEQRSHKPWVGGSNPPAATILDRELVIRWLFFNAGIAEHAEQNMDSAISAVSALKETAAPETLPNRVVFLRP